MLDRIDKALLKVLLRNRHRSLTTNEIARKAEVANLTAKRHLKKLEKLGYVESELWGRLREYHAKRNIKVKVGQIVELREGFNPKQLKIISVKPLRGETLSGYDTFKLKKQYIQKVFN